MIIVNYDCDGDDDQYHEDCGDCDDAIQKKTMKTIPKGVDQALGVFQLCAQSPHLEEIYFTIQFNFIQFLYPENIYQSHDI